MVVLLLGRLVVARLVCLVLHEGAHACAALVLGYRECRINVFTWQPLTRVHNLESHDRDLIRHAGWLASVLIALLCTWTVDSVGSAVAWLTAAEAIQSDLLRVAQPAANGSVSGDANSFFCGNFGLLLLNGANKHMVKPIIRKMIKITMMRGAQSAGVVTYVPPVQLQESSLIPRVGGVGHRHRVLNGKRSDLADKLIAKARKQLSPASISSHTPQLFQGHTRFATSSISDLPGTHPHQWSKPSHQTYWSLVPEGTSGSFAIRARPAHVEAYVTHNGMPWHALLCFAWRPPITTPRSSRREHLRMSTQHHLCCR